MITARQITRSILPAIRKARWRYWFVAVALACMLGLFSIGLTHHHQTLAAELACPVCHMTAHGAPDLLSPAAVPATSFAGWYRHTLPHQSSFVAAALFALRPQPRAPPVPATSVI